MWRWFKKSLLVICAILAIAAGWVHWRSYRISSVAHWYGEKSWVGIYCSQGRIVVGVGRERIESLIKHDYYERPVKARRDDADFDVSFHGGQWLGIGYYQLDSPKVGYILAPIWLVWALMTTPPAVMFWKRLKRSRRVSGNLCVNCGYGLRESSGRCPECGRQMAGQTPSEEGHASSMVV